MQNNSKFSMDQFNIIFKHNSDLKIKCDNYIKNSHQFQYTIENFNFEIFQKYYTIIYYLTRYLIKNVITNYYYL